VAKLRRKLRKSQRELSQLPTELEQQKLLRQNEKLLSEKAALCEEVEELRGLLRRRNNNAKDGKVRADAESLSPEWIANTNTKITAIERNIAKL
jgi:hypothetical protein